VIKYELKGEIKMRRKDKEIIDINEKLEIIEKCKYCRLGLSDDSFPYIVPLNYGFSYENEKLTLYFHGAKEGKKLDIIQKNNNVCFEIDCDAKLIEAENPCEYGYEYKSIIGFGRIIILEKFEEKMDGLNYLMKQQVGKYEKNNFTENELNNVMVYKMAVDEFTGKRSPVKK
jgi:nitroimidazol reductase NimA-like FMN-containing flavoprotein (pyridoxamine 5'-phosphate oxidase superfamily)